MSEKPSRRWRAASRHRNAMRSARNAALRVIDAVEMGSAWRSTGRMWGFEAAAFGLSQRQRAAAARPLTRYCERGLATIDIRAGA